MAEDLLAMIQTSFASAKMGLPPRGVAKSASPSVQSWITGSDVAWPSAVSTIREPFRQHGVVHRAITANMTACSRFALEVYPTGDDQDDPIEGHWLPELWRKPGPLRRGNQLSGAISMWLDLVGEAFLVHRDVRRGALTNPRRPQVLALLDPRAMTEVVVSGELTGWRFMGATGLRNLSLEEVTFFRLESPYSEWRGLGPLQAAWIEYSGDYRAALWNRSFLENDAVPPIVFTADKDMTWPDAERTAFIESWKAKHSGPLRKGEPGALPAGVMPEMLKVTAQEMDFIAGRTFSREQILMILGVPPAVAGVPASGAGNYQNYSQQLKSYHFDKVLPRVEYIESVVTTDILQRYEPESEAFFATEGYTAEIVAEDYATKVETAMKLWGVGVPMTELNERLRLGLVTEGRPWLDVGYLPFSVVPAEQVLNPPEPEPVAGPSTPPDDIDEDDEEIEQETVARSVTGERARAALWRGYERRMAASERKLLGDWRKFLLWLRDRVLAEIPAEKSLRGVGDLPPADEIARQAVRMTDATIKLTIKTSWDQLLAELQLDPLTDLDPRALQVLTERQVSIKGAADSVSAKLRESMGEGLDAGESPQELARRVRDLTAEQYRGQARTVARTESGAAFSRARVEAMDANGIKSHEWLTARDTKVRESHMIDGQVQQIGVAFSNGLVEPHDPQAAAEEVINCRCTTVPVVGD